MHGFPSIKLFGTANKRIMPTDYGGGRDKESLLAAMAETVANIAKEGGGKPAPATPPAEPKAKPSGEAPKAEKAEKPKPKPKAEPKAEGARKQAKPPASPPAAMPKMLRRHELEAMGPKALVDKVLELQEELKAWYEL